MPIGASAFTPPLLLPHIPTALLLPTREKGRGDLVFNKWTFIKFASAWPGDVPGFILIKMDIFMSLKHGTSGPLMVAGAEPLPPYVRPQMAWPPWAILLTSGRSPLSQRSRTPPPAGLLAPVREALLLGPACFAGVRAPLGHMGAIGTSSCPATALSAARCSLCWPSRSTAACRPLCRLS